VFAICATISCQHCRVGLFPGAHGYLTWRFALCTPSRRAVVETASSIILYQLSFRFISVLSVSLPFSFHIVDRSSESFRTLLSFCITGVDVSAADAPATAAATAAAAVAVGVPPPPAELAAHHSDPSAAQACSPCVSRHP
jgi:hypothetical protein